MMWLMHFFLFCMMIQNIKNKLLKVLIINLKSVYKVGVLVKHSRYMYR